MYIELHASSAFSFLRAASLPETLVERAAALGYPALALLDRDGVYGAPRFHKAARAAGLRPLIGAELTIDHHRITRRVAAAAITRSPRSEDHQLTTSPVTRFSLPVLVSSPRRLAQPLPPDLAHEAARAEGRGRARARRSRRLSSAA